MVKTFLTGLMIDKIKIYIFFICSYIWIWFWEKNKYLFCKNWKRWLKLSRRVWWKKTQLSDWFAPDQLTQAPWEQNNVWMSEIKGSQNKHGDNILSEGRWWDRRSHKSVIDYWLALDWLTQSDVRVKKREQIWRKPLKKMKKAGSRKRKGKLTLLWIWEKKKWKVAKEKEK